MSIFVFALFLSLSLMGIYSANNTAPFIFNVDPVPISFAPYMAAIFSSTFFGSPKFTCSGFFVADDRVITAKHCCKANLKFVVYNTGNVTESQKQKAYIDNCYTDTEHDVAVLVLKKSVKNVKLVVIDKNWKCTKGEILTIYGFGKNERKKSGVLRSLKAVVNYCHNKVVTQMYNKTTCYGDSGSPFITSSGFAVAVLSGGNIDKNKNCVVGGKNTGVKLSDVKQLLEKYFSHNEKNVGFWSKTLNFLQNLFG